MTDYRELIAEEQGTSHFDRELTKDDVEIEEMAKVLLPAWGKCPREKCPVVRKDLNSCDYCKCELLYAAGYRKQSDTVKEFVEKLKEEYHKAIAHNYTEMGNMKIADEMWYICGGQNEGLNFALKIMNELAERYGKEDNNARKTDRAHT